MKLTNIERFLFMEVKNVCYPIGYDKYHFLHSHHVNNNGINVNSLKHCLYHQLRTLIGNEKSTVITNQLIKNQIANQEKTEIENEINVFLVNMFNQFPNKYRKKKKEIAEIIINHLNIPIKNN